jgi:hypothetical protein
LHKLKAETHATNSYVDRIKVYAKDRISLLFFFRIFRVKGTKGHAKDDMISN